MEKKIEQLHFLSESVLCRAKEIEALFNYNCESMIINNYTRLFGDINIAIGDLEQIKDLIREIGLPY